MSGNTVMEKYEELSLGIMHSMHFFHFKLLLIRKTRNLFASTSSINLLSKPIFNLGHDLFKVTNFM